MGILSSQVAWVYFILFTHGGTAEAAGPVHQLDNQLSPGRSSVASLPETWGEGPSE